MSDKEILNQLLDWFHKYEPYGRKKAVKYLLPGWTPEEFYRSAYIKYAPSLAKWYDRSSGLSIRSCAFIGVVWSLGRYRTYLSCSKRNCSGFTTHNEGILSAQVSKALPPDEEAARNEELNLLRDKWCWGCYHAPKYLQTVAEHWEAGISSAESARILGVTRERIAQKRRKLTAIITYENDVNPAPLDFHKKFNPKTAWRGDAKLLAKTCELCGKKFHITAESSWKYCKVCRAMSSNKRKQIFDERKKRNV